MAKVSPTEPVEEITSLSVGYNAVFTHTDESVADSLPLFVNSKAGTTTDDGLSPDNAVETTLVKEKNTGQRRSKMRQRIQCSLCSIKGFGRRCRHCGVVEVARLQLPLPKSSSSDRRTDVPIRGIATATWITDKILAMSRPSTRSFEQYELIEQLLAFHVGAVYNTEEVHEHPYCGEGLCENGGFSYRPADLEKAGIDVHLIGWIDLGVPPINLVLDAVLSAAEVLDSGRRIAVHCHAGFGRTGVLIACILIYMENLTAAGAITAVRFRRPRCIQNRWQRTFVVKFAEALPGMLKARGGPLSRSATT